MANERRLIDANALETRMGNLCDEFGTDHLFIDAIIYEIGTAPTVDAVEVVHGRWERCGGDLHSSGYAIFCSICNKTHFVHRRYSLGGLSDNELFIKPKYCPSCGAVMEVEE